MATTVNKRVRKTPQQQIDDARAALQRAMQRQRAANTRQKVVVGALTQKWLLATPAAGRAFAGWLRSIDLREQDLDAIESFLQELNNSGQTQTSPGGD